MTRSSMNPFLLPRTWALCLSLWMVTIASAAGLDVKGLLPAGGQRGQQTEVNLVGQSDPWPVDVWSSSPHVQAIANPDQPGKLQVTVQAQATPGVHWLRIHHAHGASKLLPFIVGTVEESVESGDVPAGMELDEPHVVNGRVGQSEEVDQFRVRLRQDEVLLASVDAHRRLGSPMDGVLQLATPEGIVLRQNDDFRGLDPRLEFTAPADGEYLVRLFAFPASPNSRIGLAGADDFIYRLTLSKDGFVDYAFPLTTNGDLMDAVRAVGPAVDGDRTVRSLSQDGQKMNVCVASQPGWGEVAIVQHPIDMEAADCSLDSPQLCPWPITISGRIEVAGDEDAYRIRCREGQRLRIRVESSSLGFHMDPVLEVFDAESKSLAKNDDRGQDRDPSLDFTAPGDGHYDIQIRDLHNQGSPQHVYRCQIQRVEPSFSLSVDQDAYEGSQESPTEIVVSITRQDGFDQTIDVTALGLPTGVLVAAGRSRPDDDSKSKVTVGIQANAACRSSFFIMGVSQQQRQTALALPPGRGAQLPPPDLWLTVPPR